MYKLIIILGFLFLFYNISFAQSSISSESQICISCHEMVTPGIVKDWKVGVHSKITLKEALSKDSLSRKVNSSPSFKNKIET